MKAHISLPFCGFFCALLFGSTCGAATKAEKQKAAASLVREALQREIYGMDGQREKLLERAAKENPNFGPAMWHRGYVRHHGEWVKADETEQFNRDPRLALYQGVRDQHTDDAASQLSLANWCRKRGLADQERAHLERVIQLQPDHAQAHARLGFRRVDGAWVRAEEIADAQQKAATDQKCFADWRAKIVEIRVGLTHDSTARRQHAEKQLTKITDPAAIVALESILSGHSARLALLVLKTVDEMSDRAAALCLARHAVYSPWPQVRQDAAERLRQWRVEAYAPSMLAEMSTPVESRMNFFRAPGGRLVYRHSFFRRTQDENRLLVTDTAYRRVAVPTGDVRETTARAIQDVQANAIQTQQNVAFENLRTEEMNLRIGKALAIATQQRLAPSPDAWWAWWTDYNEVFVAVPKPTNSIYRPREVAIVDRPQIPIVDEGAAETEPVTETRESLPPSSSGLQRTTRWRRQGRVLFRDDGIRFDGLRTRQGFQIVYDCLKAGTPVWTSGGRVAVEQVKTGDLVLSQDVESGELAYKPVLRSTIRPASDLVVIDVGNETIQASGGHPFWVSGEGWVKARQLEPGMQLHGFDGTSTISDVRTGGKEKTYNLIVADFHTYFIGKNKVLNHDNTVRATTDALVPGLIGD